MQLSFGYGTDSLCTIRFGNDLSIVDKRLIGWGIDNDNGTKNQYYIGYKKINGYNQIDLFIKMKSDLGYGNAIVYRHSSDSSNLASQTFTLNTASTNYTDEDMDKIVDLYAESKTVWKYYGTYDIEIDDTTTYTIDMDNRATELFVELGSVNPSGMRQTYGGTSINIIKPYDNLYATKPSYITTSMYNISEWVIFYIYWNYKDAKFTYQVYNWLDTSGQGNRDARIQVYWK